MVIIFLVGFCCIVYFTVIYSILKYMIKYHQFYFSLYKKCNYVNKVDYQLVSWVRCGT